jgi:hypothetical protein
MDSTPAYKEAAETPYGGQFPGYGSTLIALPAQVCGETPDMFGLKICRSQIVNPLAAGIFGKETEKLFKVLRVRLNSVVTLSLGYCYFYEKIFLQLKQGVCHLTAFPKNNPA